MNWGRVLCFFELHKWEYSSILRGHVVTDYAWCLRTDCRYHSGIIVNEEYHP